MGRLEETPVKPSWIEVTTLGDLLVRAASRWPDADAVVFPETRLTYAGLLERATQAARAIKAMGVQKGDHVGILMPNCMDFVELLFGCAMLGAVLVPVNARFKARELAYVIANSDIAVLFTTDIIQEYANFVELLHEGLPGLADSEDPMDLHLAAAPRLRCAVLMGRRPAAGFLGRGVFESLAGTVEAKEVDASRRRVRLRDVAIMMYTSGTTANPKGCPLTHEALVRTGMAMGRERYLLTPEDRFWDPLPMFHMASILPMVATFDAGAAFLTMGHFDPDQALDMIEREGATVLYPSFPTITQALIHHPRFRTMELGRVRMMNNVAPPETLRSMQQAIPHAIQVSAYGCTEVGGVISFNELTDDEDKRCHSCGRPFAGIEVRISDLVTGKALGPGEKGEILVRGYSVFEGYYKDPDKTAASLDEEGWFHTGDLGALDEDGRIIYLGRIKDMLKVGGENVAAAEIESYLGTHPAVKIVQVVGVPDDRLVEVPAAFVELHDGATVTAEEIIDYCKGKIASFKVPRYVRFVTDWPMSATKIQKFRLREQLAEELAGKRDAG